MDALREHVLNLLAAKDAHLPFEEAIADFSQELSGTLPPGAPHTAWQLLEHLRITQWDILEFSRDPKHVSPQWPEGYWPKTQAPPSSDAWRKSAEQFTEDLQAMRDLVADPSADLFAPFSHGDGQTLLREALLLADHNSYHLGQLIFLRKLLGHWKD